MKLSPAQIHALFAATSWRFSAFQGHIWLIGVAINITSGVVQYLVISGPAHFAVCTPFTPTKPHKRKDDANTAVDYDLSLWPFA